MGACHTTLASASAGSEEQFVPELDAGSGSSQQNLPATSPASALDSAAAGHQAHDLSAYVVDQPLFPGSGRMMRTFRLRHRENGSTVVLKTMNVSKEQENLVQEQEQELKRIREALQGQPHVAPFTYWNLGSYRPKQMNSNVPTMVRQVSLLRPHLYTTLSDRLASRPFLTHVEKLWIAYQLLHALEAMHNKGVVHGLLTTENIGLSSWNWVVILDISSYKARTALPDDDPTEYLYYFQENYSNSLSQGRNTTRREKRCYLAPERFYSPNLDSSQPQEQPELKPSMDIFSAGCVLMETFLNGERALDLGDLMEYRKKETSATLQQKLNKIEYSALRAACRHMLTLNPDERLSPSAYLERLQASDLVPPSFASLADLMEKATFAPPDFRLAVATAYYPKILWEATGLRDILGERYVRSILGPHMANRLCDFRRVNMENGDAQVKTRMDTDTIIEEKKEDAPLSNEDLFAETEALLKQLEYLNIDDAKAITMAADEASSTARTSKSSDIVDSAPAQRSEISQQSLLVYLQLILATVRHVQRPSSKLVALQLMNRLAKYSGDEARLQRIVPVAVSLLQDQDPLVRASAIQVLCSTVSVIESFPPSDSKVFPEYIFKRVAHMVADTALVVRIAFAKNVALLAETSQRFLDISHAVRLYEAIGGGASSSLSDSKDGKKASANNLFGDDVANLLDASTATAPGKTLKARDSSGFDSFASEDDKSGKNLIKSTYTLDLSALQETVTKWVVHIATDQSEQSSPTKRALLSDMPRLCGFYGLDGVMAFILPQVLSFLNDRKDWQLRAAVFDCLPALCHIIGRAATEHFVLPCLETALADGTEFVVSRTLQCLSHLLKMGLLSRSVMLGTPAIASAEPLQSLLKKYVIFLIHPSADIRFFAVATINTFCQTLQDHDADVFVTPILKPYLRFRPTIRHLTSREGLEQCLLLPWPRQRFQKELEKLRESSASGQTAGQWTSIAFQVLDHDQKSPGKSKSDNRDGDESSGGSADIATQQFRLYLQQLARSRTNHSQIEDGVGGLRSHLNHCIDGSLKLSQQIKFPRQNIPGLPSSSIPAWYDATREVLESKSGCVSESVAIRSVASLGQVFGLSVMEQSAGIGSVIPKEQSADDAVKLLESDESKHIEAACTGEWGSETTLNPTLSDTSLLVTKLNALKVPPLPPRLNEEKAESNKGANIPPGKGSVKDTHAAIPEWKLKIDTMVASSRCSPENGHVAPIVRLVVSHDQRFFVTGSYDSTCRVWEIEMAEQSSGLLSSSTAYTGHSNARVNDVAMVEGGHSVISGGSDGSIHVWRVDLVSSIKQGSGQNERKEVSRAIGTTEVRRSNPDEGEILAVNHFNTASASICTYATQKGVIHSWDLRSASEPFSLTMPQDTGYITSMAMGSDRNWIVAGTSKGYISLWDLRFQQTLKLWRHSRAAPVNRLATSFVPPPQSWIGRGGANSEARPFLFAACGPNECAMFDLTTGDCRECFRTVDFGSRFSKARLDEMPTLQEVSLSNIVRRKAFLSQGYHSTLPESLSSSFRSINAMVGSIGASDQSFLITGGSDCRIRFWDFGMPSKCYVSTGPETIQPRPTFERIDYNQDSRLMICRQPPTPSVNDVDSSKIPRKLVQGTKRAEKIHEDAITDLKVVRGGLLSCSRDCTVKLWR